MNPLTSTGRLTPLAPLTPLQPLNPTPGSSAVTPLVGTPSAFETVLGQVMGPVNETNAKADMAIRALATGDATDLHQVSLAAAEADLAFRLMLEMRNRLTEAYQEITRMQI